MTLLLQVSDPHFGTDQPPVVKALQQLAQSLKPDALVLSGDITQRAEAAEFAEARAFCDSLGIARTLVVPGNHDIPLFNIFGRLFNPYQGYRRAFGPEDDKLLELPLLQVVGLNTTRWWRHKNGQVSAAQIAWVSRQLSRGAPGQLRVVVVHQPVYVLKAEDEHDRLRGWEAAVRAWAAAGADIVMGGHIHLPYARELSAVVPALGRRMWCVQAGTAVSSRIRRGVSNSVNVLRYDGAVDAPRQCGLERWDFRMATGRFELGQTTQMMLGADSRSAVQCRT
jgi:3',5'-cyclic AMP phosphodiesterase CpdA